MKNYIIYLLLFFTALTINSQEKITDVTLTNKQTKEVKDIFITYFNELSKTPKEYNKILDYTYPKLFDAYAKDLMISQLKKSFGNPLFTITFDQIEFKEIKQSFSFEEIIYTKTIYKSIMSLKFKKEEDQSDTDFNEYLDFMLVTYKNQFKDSEVTKKDTTISIAGNKNMILIHDKKYNKPCYMIELLENNEIYYTNLIP